MQKIKKFKQNEKRYSILIILIASIIICLPLLNSKIDMMYDDGVQHICRIIGTSQGIATGNTNIFQNFCNGFGYSWNVFYSPLTAFVPLIFRIFSFGYAACIKLFIFLVVFLSGYFMYVFTKKTTKNNSIAILSAILYIFAPYRITDMYIRNALAELTSFTFLPIIFLGLYNVFHEEKSKKVYLPLIIGSAGLFLTHSVITLYTAIIALIYIIISVFKQKDALKVNISKRNELIKRLVVSVIMILLITAYFWMPLLQFKNSTEYEVFRPGRMERTEVLVAYKLDFYSLFFTLGSDHMIYQIGWVTLLGLVLTPIVYKKIKQTRYLGLYKFLLFLGIISVIMTLRVFPFEYLPSALKMLQFSFRMLEFSSFAFSFIAAINIVVISKKFKNKELLIILGLIVLCTIPFNSHFVYRENYDEQWLINTVPVTEQTGRVHAGCASFEYLPTKAFKNRDYIETRSQEAIVLNENENTNIEIINQQKNNEKMCFEIKQINTEEENEQSKENTDEIEIELPYIYYPGYSVTIENNNIKEELQTYESDKGFVMIKIQNDKEGTVNVEYKGTQIMSVSKLVSLLGVCIFIILLNEERLKKQTNEKFIKEKNG